MKVYKEISSLNEFEAWIGGRETLERLRELGKVEELDAILDDVFPEGCSETELNDFLWFDRDTIAEWIGHDGDLFDDEEEEENDNEDEDE